MIINLINTFLGHRNNSRISISLNEKRIIIDHNPYYLNSIILFNTGIERVVVININIEKDFILSSNPLFIQFIKLLEFDLEFNNRLQCIIEKELMRGN